MHILMEPSDYTLFNIGDTAMQQVAVARLSALFPKATIEVFTDDPKSLIFYCPNATPLSTKGRQIWLSDGYLFDLFYQLIPGIQLTELLREVERGIRRRWPSLAELLIRFRLKRIGVKSQNLNNYLKVMSKVNLMVVSGGGGITDVFDYYALGVLDILALAIRRGIPTVMFGQGIGPLKNSKLRERAKAILPQVDLICLRESWMSGPILNSLGVSPDRILTTGDDAIEMAYQSRHEQLGGSLGVNLRAANYSEVHQELIEQIRPILQNAAKRHAAPMIPIPISRVPGEEDAITIQQLLIGCCNGADGGEDLDTQSKVIEQVARCRLVVTGSYHAAVFALAQGIPAIGLAKSDYYVGKFRGLANQFGTGCEVVLLNDPQLPVKLSEAIEKMWCLAEQVRPHLLDAATRQIELGHAAYRRVSELVRSQK